MVLLANPGNQYTLLDVGIPITLVNAVAAAQILGNAGQALNVAPYGTGTNPIFTVQPGPSAPDRTLNLHAKSATAVPTSLTVTCYCSDDGVTWTQYQQPLNLIEGGVATDQQILHLVSGLQYQLLVTGLVLGSATTVSIDGSIS